MRKGWKILVSGTVSFLIAFLVIEQVALPTLDHYARLSRVMARFYYTDEVLVLFVGLTIWLFYLQWQMKRLSVIYVYLFYSVYLFLLFVVLFTKAATYHTFTLNPFDFISWNRRVLEEAALNIGYFIPLGILYRLRAKPWQFWVLAFSTVLGIETIQYVFYIGTFALSDILLNVLGCYIGYRLGRRMLQHFKAMV